MSDDVVLETPPVKIPHPIPYQGSKRNLASLISNYLPSDIDVWFEPFAGSAALSLWMARHYPPRKIVLADSLEPLAMLWREIIGTPESVAGKYREIWEGQKEGDHEYFNRIRQRFNERQQPVDLLYLLCRCVKNAVRFNAKGHFTQSVDRRRLGMQPAKMEAAINGASDLLRGRTEVRGGDWMETTKDASEHDFVYMDPPYLGTSQGRDRRYAAWMSQESLISGLTEMRARGLRFALSYDGMTGSRTYGPPLPSSLGMTQLLLHAGRSSQATLNGGNEETFESLYLSGGLLSRPAHATVMRQKELELAL